MPANSHTVAVIDDDESLCQALTRILTLSGFSVRTYYSAESFIEDPGFRNFSSLVVDVGLPGMSGVELAEQLHSFAEFTANIIFMSADDSPDVLRQAEAVGCVTFFNKPFFGRDLAKVLRATEQP